MKVLSKFVAGALGFSLLLGVTGCNRDHIEAINLSNEGDKAYRVNVEGAISKYEQATQLDPTNHRILWKLAKAYERKEDWDKVASTASRAVQIAPDFANYWYKRGFALMQLARAGDKDRYEEAKEPLKKCIEKDPNYAECYHELAEADLWTDDLQGAVENYSKAIEHDPTVGYFYAPLADVYVTLRLYDEAEKVLKEATRLLQPTEKNANYLHASYVLMAKVYQAKGDNAAMITALEKAHEIGGDKHAEDKFFLGSAYATKEPPNKEKAVRLLNSFSKTSCRGAKAKQFKEQCQAAQDLIQKLGGAN
ncbi:MAG: tetratricopeptide repeat protein [Myxococcales bacterium]|nr:tetratricopeptide repeat protein [Myxococcales bacterium]